MKTKACKASGKWCTECPLTHPPALLGAGHFAFVRALLQGVDANACWNQYLAADGRPATRYDLRQAIESIRNSFAVVSRQHGRPGLARLVLSGLPLRERKHSTETALDDFVVANALDGFSEAEQLAFHAKQYGANSPKRARLLARQLDAVNWLQKFASQPTPQRETIDGWLAPHLADRLAEAGIKNTVALRHLMQQRPNRWWHGIKAVGLIKATRIAAALPQLSELVDCNAAHPPPVGAAVDWRSDCHVRTRIGDGYATPERATPYRSQTEAIHHRGAHAWLSPEHVALCVYPADVEAVRRWLEVGVGRRGNRSNTQDPPTISVDRLHKVASAGSVAPPLVRPPSGRNGSTTSICRPAEELTHTQRAYWKEAQRFLLWLAIERRATLETLTARDCSAYAAFLEAPEARWCGSRARGRQDPAWRPFEGPLSRQMRSYGIRVLRNLCQFLISEGIMRVSPWENASADPVTRLMSARRNVPQVFDLDAWDVMKLKLAQMPPTSANSRMRVAIHLLRSTGVRLGELVRAGIDDLESPATPLGPWLLRRRCTTGPLPAALLQPDVVYLLQSYLVTRGLNPSLLAPENRGARLLGKVTDAAKRALSTPRGQTSFDPRDGIGLGTMTDQLRAFFQLCAQACADQPTLARQFEQANSHWLRGGPKTQ